MLGRRNEATKVRLSLSNLANLGVHLTHLIKQIVKMSTKIIQNKQMLIQDGSKRCLHSRRRRWKRWGRRSRGIGNILSSSKLNLFLLSRSRLLTRPLGLSHQLSRAPTKVSLLMAPIIGNIGEKGKGTSAYEKMRVIVKGKFKLITCSKVLIDIQHGHYHMWRKVYRETFEEREKKNEHEAQW